MEIDPTKRFAGRVHFRHQPVLARIENQFLGRNFLQVERRNAGNDLECRSWRIFAGYRPIVHGVERILVDRFPILCRNAADKMIRVKRRATDHRQDFACFRIHYDYSAGLGLFVPGLRLQVTQLFVQCILGRLLQPVVDSKHQVVAGHGVFFRQHLDHPSGDIDFDLATAVASLELTVIAAFQARLTDQVCGPVTLTAE